MSERRERNYSPMSTAGLIRYFDEDESAIRLKPEHIVYMSIAFGAVVLLLRFLI